MAELKQKQQDVSFSFSVEDAVNKLKSAFYRAFR